MRTGTSRALVALATTAMLVPAAPAFAQTAPDTQPPQVVSFDVSPTTVDVTSGQATINYTACVSDETATTGTSLLVSSNNTTQSVSSYTNWLTTGTRQNGCYTDGVIVPRGSAPGVWTANLIVGGDTFGNLPGFPFPQQSVTVINGPTATPTTPPPTTPPTTPPTQQPLPPQSTATPTPLPTATPTATPTTPAPTAALTGFTASRPVIDYGDTVDVTVTGTPGLPVSLFINNQRIPSPRLIREATIGANGSFTWTGLRPEDSTTFSVRGVTVDPTATPSPVTVRVRRDVTIGVSQANGVYTFSGQLQRAEAGVQVTVARLDSETKRVTGVASTTTDAAGRYTIRTGLPQGFAGYYTLTEAANGLDAGRSRLYGLIVNTRPGTPPTAQSLSLDVRPSGRAYTFEGVLSPARGGVPVTLAQVVNGRLVGMAGGVTEANGRYIITIQPPPGTYFFTALTANARSRNYGLVVPAAPVRQPVVSTPVTPSGGTISRPADRDCGDFGGSQAAAQAFFERYRAQFGDFADLDRNNDDIACNSLL